MEIPSLQEICMNYITRNPKFRTLEGILVLFSSRIDLELPTFAPIKVFVERNIREFFPFLLEKIGLEELKENFPSIDWDKQYQDHRQLQDAKGYFLSLKGTILERRPTVNYISDFYPYEALKSGVEWPSNVDPTRRETFLSDDDFFNIFQMTKEEFRQLPNFVRKRIKQEKELF